MGKTVGYGHVQKVNIFHQVNREPEYKITNKESILAAAKGHTDSLLESVSRDPRFG